MSDHIDKLSGVVDTSAFIYSRMAYFNHFKINCVIFFFAFVHFTTAFVWESNGVVRRAKNCDFVGNDIETNSTFIFPEVCEATCRDKPPCTHFSWSARQSGTCVLKSSHLSDSSEYESLAVDATHQQGSVCGFLEFSWEHEHIFTYNCDFFYTTFLNIKTTKLDECVDLCNSTVQCTHFTWTMFIEPQQDIGKCVLKTGEVSKQYASYAPHKICGLSGRNLQETGGGGEYLDATTVRPALPERQMWRRMDRIRR